MKCGCKSIQDVAGHYYGIEFCPLHSAAGDLLRALRDILDAATLRPRDLNSTGSTREATLHDALLRGHAAIQKAEEVTRG